MLANLRSSFYGIHPPGGASIICSKLSVVCLALIGVAQATSSQKETNQIANSLHDTDINVVSQNACLDNSRENCPTSHFERAYDYDPNEIIIEQHEATIRGREYSIDRLSEKDILAYKIRNPTYWQAQGQETLKQVLFIHRHGDRTPINFPSRDNLADEPFWKFHGLGQLTNRGKARLHLLGNIVRQRYDRFLEGSVNKNSRKSRASGSLRCIESAQVFLSSFLTLDNPNSPDANSLVWDNATTDRLSHLWQPASVNTLAAKYDGMLNEGAQCNIAEGLFAMLDESDENQQLMREYKHEIEVLKRELDFEVDHFYKWFWASSLLEVERSYFEHKMKPAILDIYDRLDQAGNRALVLYQSSLKLRRARVGLLIDDMIKNMKVAREESANAKKFVHYSAHDINLIFLLGVFENIDKFSFRPDYASNLLIELHQDSAGWFLKFFYMSKVPTKPIELHLEACEEEGRCSLDKFIEAMQKYRVTSWSNWMHECGNSLEQIDPYAENS